ncbi:UNVERIFIED_CONTAM: hypothetical protein RMT77_011184 [Armadillidium vulgare]
MEGEKAIGITTLISFLILIFAYLNSNSNFNAENDLQKRLSQILDAMLEIENDHTVGKVRIAVGYGACNDLFVKASELLENESPPSATKHYGHIQTMEQLKEMYALFFSSGSAAERFVSNETLFMELVKRAESLPTGRYVLGGNAPVMAKRFAMEGGSVMLGAKRNDYLLKSLLPNMAVSGGPTSGSRDDIHLIMEYYKGEKWGDYLSTRANRFIIHNDISNPKLSSALEFGKELERFKPHLLVIGGLQMMDNYPYAEGEREKYLTEVHRQIFALPKSTLVHFEMASFTDEALLKDLNKYVTPNVDSLGMNEQELPNLYTLLKYGNVSVVSHQNPRVAEVLDQMREIFRVLGSKGEKTIPEHRDRILTRMHVHTLAFQAIMVDLRSQWKNTRAAVTKAALVAHRHVCHKKEVEVSHSNILMDEGFSLSTHPNTGRVMFDALKPVSCWIEDTHYQICIAPVLVCTKVQQTAGGGDNISAAGLVLQI